MQQKKGFTLVEILTAMGIFTTVIVVITGLLIYYLQGYTFSFEETQSIGQAQGSMTRMIREIREARTGENGAWPVVQADDNTFIFFADITNDGRSDRVRYFLEGTDLKKGVIEPTTVPVGYPAQNEKITIIASNVDNQGSPLFTYYNGDWPSDQVTNPLAAGQRLLNTRFVSVYIRININPDSGSQPYELTSGVQIRSLKDNL